MSDSQKEFEELHGVNILQYVTTHVTTLSFPEKLMYLMMSVENQAAQTAKKASDTPIAWDPTGTAIMVLNAQELERLWFPLFFGANCKWKSFTRKLYRWGFRKFRQEAAAGRHEQSDRKQLKSQQECFQHPHFQRDQKNLLYKMENTTIDKTQRTLSLSRSRRNLPGVRNQNGAPGSVRDPSCTDSSKCDLPHQESAVLAEVRTTNNMDNNVRNGSVLPPQGEAQHVTLAAQLLLAGHLRAQQHSALLANSRHAAIPYNNLLAALARTNHGGITIFPIANPLIDTTALSTTQWVNPSSLFSNRGDHSTDQRPAAMVFYPNDQSTKDEKVDARTPAI